MTPNEADRFRSSLKACYALYKSDLAPEAIALFFKVMERYELPAVEAALAAHMQDPERGKFPPRPADLIAKLELPEQEALEFAWSEFRKATRSGDMPTDPVLRRVIKRLGGLEYLGDRTSRDLDFMRDSMQTLYKAECRFAGIGITLVTSPNPEALQ